MEANKAVLAPFCLGLALLSPPEAIAQVACKIASKIGSAL